MEIEITMSELKAINVSFGERNHHFFFEINKNEIVFIIGRNGEGKSTLLLTIAGLLPLKSGDFIFNGNNISSGNEVDRIKQGIRIALEDRQIFPNLSVKENIYLGGYQLNKNKRDTKYNEIIELFYDLKINEKKISKTLSGGQQTQLNIARSLMGDTKLLLLDEPSLGLDPVNVNKLVAIIREFTLKNDLSVVVVDNNIKLIKHLANRIIKLENGVMSFANSIESAIENGLLSDFYP